MTELIWCVIGFWIGVALMCLLAVARDPAESACSGNCNQGRKCDCAQ